jgi:2-polyprenylphenol 6-hydroxylase
MNLPFKSTVDVAVVGAGVAGLVTALALSRLRPDRKLCLLGLSAGGDQVLTLTPRSMAFLEGLGLQLRGKAQAVHQMRVFSGSELSFDAADSGMVALAWVIRQSEIQQQLEQLLAQHGVARQSRSLDTMTLLPSLARRRVLEVPGAEGVAALHVSASLWVAADGGQSGLRALAGIAAERHPYPQTALVAQWRIPGLDAYCAYQWFGDHGVLALLPMGEQRYCMIWSAPHVAPNDLASLLLAASPTELGERLGQVIAEFQCELLAPLRSFPLSRVRAESMVADRLALVGDAGHLIHPLAGQGLNLGLADAQALVETLVALPPSADVGDAIVLRRYARARAEPVALMLGLTHALQKGFEAPTRPKAADQVWRAARELGWKGVQLAQPLKQALIRRASI